MPDYPSGFSPELKHQASRMSGERAYGHLRQVAGGDWPADIDWLEIINEAGHFLCTMHPWKWLECGQVRLDLRKNISITNGVCKQESSWRVESEDAFADYTWLEGDILQITGGTNVAVGHYQVSTQYDESGINLARTPLVDILSGAVDGTSIAATLHASACALPNDFREIIAIYATQGTNNQVLLTTYQDLLEKRATNTTSPGTYYAALSHAMDVENGEENVGPVARLEIWPSPTANDSGGISMFYRCGWNILDLSLQKEDNEFLLKMPAYCESLYIEILRAFGRSRVVYFDPNAAGVDLNVALEKIMLGPLFQTAVDRDGSVQPDVGPILHGAAMMGDAIHPFSNYTTVNAPS